MEFECDSYPGLDSHGRNTFTEGDRERIMGLAGRYHQQLVEDIQQNYLAGQAVKWAKFA